MNDGPKFRLKRDRQANFAFRDLPESVVSLHEAFKLHGWYRLGDLARLEPIPRFLDLIRERAGSLAAESDPLMRYSAKEQDYWVDMQRFQAWFLREIFPGKP